MHWCITLLLYGGWVLDVPLFQFNIFKAYKIKTWKHWYLNFIENKEIIWDWIFCQNKMFICASMIVISVVKIASWLAESAEFTTYPSLSERNRAQNRRRRGSVPDRRSESHNRRNGVRSDSDQCARGGRKKRVVLVFYQTHRFVIITKQKRTVSFIWLFLILFYFLN
jgi:hypothetical protein